MLGMSSLSTHLLPSISPGHQRRQKSHFLSVSIHPSRAITGSLISPELPRDTSPAERKDVPAMYRHPCPQDTAPRPFSFSLGGAVAAGGVESSWEQGGEGNRQTAGRRMGPWDQNRVRDTLCIHTSAPALLLIYLSFNAFWFVLGFFFSNLF